MKRNTVMLCFALSMMAIACKEDDTTLTITETPAKTVISVGSLVDTFELANAGSYEFGYKFFVSKDGSITKLGCKMGNKGTFRVSLWDFTTTNLIAATTITVTDTLNFTYNAVSPIPLTANTRYVISLNNTSGGVNRLYYRYYKKPALGLITFPFSSGSATFEIGLYANSTTSVFPTVSGANPNYIWGIPDFQFTYTE